MENRNGEHKTNFIKTVSVSYIVGMAYVVMVCACAGSIMLPAQAAPATLTSSDATVYEQADGGSSPVGNLVEGSSFEYIGDVTATDGSVWHQITTSSGVNGYIRGDKGMEIEAEEESARDGQGGQADSSAESVPAENGQEDGAGGAEAEAVPEEDGTGNEELSEESIGLEESSTAAVAMSMQNNQAKKYVMDPLGKVKEREIFTGSDTSIQNMKSAGAGTDKALFTGMAVVFFCAVTVHICLTRIRMLRGGMDGREAWNAGRGRNHRKTEKKRHSQKRRTKKTVQDRKEGVKTPKAKK